MLIEMAQMSAEDGMVMQIHAGSTRSTNRALADRFGPDMGADIPRAMNWVDGLDALLNRVGNDPRFRLIVFTLDEASYARELAPMAGHWPALQARAALVVPRQPERHPPLFRRGGRDRGLPQPRRVQR
jgi:glucuronate isomerase